MQHRRRPSGNIEGVYPKIASKTLIGDQQNTSDYAKEITIGSQFVNSVSKSCTVFANMKANRIKSIE
jgi:hypothetical protein